MRIALELSYCGKNYHGWQAQPNAISIQEKVEEALSLINREKISITGAGRTDTGVHASYFVAHFDILNPINPEQQVYQLNSILPSDISIFSLKEMQTDFHARFSAERRTYKYIICKKKSPFLEHLATIHTSILDINKMNEAASFLHNVSDFTSFSKLHSNNQTNFCKIYNSEWHETDDYFIYTITADRFLRNMVRSITGTILDVGKKKISLARFREIVGSLNNQNASVSAPAQGLYLFDIRYQDKFQLHNPFINRLLPFN